MARKVTRKVKSVRDAFDEHGQPWVQHPSAAEQTIAGRRPTLETFLAMLLNTISHADVERWHANRLCRGEPFKAAGM